jgi:hypothetical protein
MALALARGLALLALALVGARPAAAGTRATAPVRNDIDRVGCMAQNLGSKPRLVTATLRDVAGTALQSQSLELPPGLTFELVFVSSFQAAVYCEFEGLNRRVRGFLEVQPFGGGTSLLVLPAE